MNKPQPGGVWGLIQGQAQRQLRGRHTSQDPGSQPRSPPMVTAAFPWEDHAYLRSPLPVAQQREVLENLQNPFLIWGTNWANVLHEGLFSLNHLYEHHSFTSILLNFIKLSIYSCKFLLDQISLKIKHIFAWWKTVYLVCPSVSIMMILIIITVIAIYWTPVCSAPW